MTLEAAVAALVLASVLAMTIWAQLRSGTQGFVREFTTLWSLPWGKQVVIDFYGLEIVLVLWMLGHAAEAGSWWAFGICAALMPIFGASAAAAYWLVAVG